MKKILVTGGAGFIGSHTVDLLLAENFHVIVYDNLATGKLAYLNLQHPHLTFIQDDILHYPALAKAIAECDVVLHLAALTSVPQSITNPIQSNQVNLLGFLHVLQAIRETQKPIRLIYASSAAVYGKDTPLPCRDDGVIHSSVLSPYALEKISNEHYANLYERLFGIKSLGLRYFNVYGPRQDPASPYSGVISQFIERYRAKQPITIFGDGKQSRDFIYVTDVAKANVLAIQSEYEGVANIATGKAETLLNLIQYIEKVGNEPATVKWAAARKGDIYQSYAAIDTAVKYLQFHASISLTEGIQKTLKISYSNPI